MNYLPHLIELRRRCFFSVIVITAVFVLFFIQASVLYQHLAKPLLLHLPKGGQLIATEVTSPFMIPLKLSLYLSLLTTLPFIFYQLWAFISPGLYKKEKTLILPLAFFSSILFYLGLAFGFVVICPLALQFFTHAAPKGVTVMTDITHYFEFVFSICFACGMAFQVPLVTHLLVKLGWVSKAQLGKKRSYVIVSAFILGMILTPPDVISQILLALPIWGLYELGLLFSREPQTKNETEALRSLT